MSWITAKPVSPPSRITAPKEKEHSALQLKAEAGTTQEQTTPLLMKDRQADAQGHQTDQMKVKLAVAKHIKKYKRKDGYDSYDSYQQPIQHVRTYLLAFQIANL